MASISRPTWWSVCSRNPAYTSIWRASTGLSSSGMSSHAGDLVVARGQLGVGRDDPELLLPGEGALALDVPAVVELAGVLVGPLLRHVVRRVRRARREVDEERLVRHQRLLLAHPAHRAVGQVLGQVVALLRGGRRLDRASCRRTAPGPTGCSRRR